MEVLNQELARAAYDTHLPMAMALPADRVRDYRIQPDLAINNVNRAMKVVTALRGDIPVHLPRISLATLDALPSMALALKMSAMLAESVVPTGVSMREMIAEGWKLRATLLSTVASLAAAGAIPHEVHANIVRGRGTRDMAEDCVALGAVFRDYKASVAGKHAVDPAMIARAEVVGSWLLQNLRRVNAPRVTVHVAPEIDIRDRMATLLVESYEKLRVVGYYFHGEDQDEHVPPLMSRHVQKRRAVEDEPAAA